MRPCIAAVEREVHLQPSLSPVSHNSYMIASELPCVLDATTVSSYTGSVQRVMQLAWEPMRLALQLHLRSVAQRFIGWTPIQTSEYGWAVADRVLGPPAVLQPHNIIQTVDEPTLLDVRNFEAVMRFARVPPSSQDQTESAPLWWGALPPMCRSRIAAMVGVEGRLWLTTQLGLARIDGDAHIFQCPHMLDGHEDLSNWPAGLPDDASESSHPTLVSLSPSLTPESLQSMSSDPDMHGILQEFV